MTHFVKMVKENVDGIIIVFLTLRHQATFIHTKVDFSVNKENHSV